MYMKYTVAVVCADQNGLFNFILIYYLTVTYYFVIILPTIKEQFSKFS